PRRQARRGHFVHLRRGETAADPRGEEARLGTPAVLCLRPDQDVRPMCRLLVCHDVQQRARRHQAPRGDPRGRGHQGRPTRHDSGAAAMPTTTVTLDHDLWEGIAAALLCQVADESRKGNKDDAESLGKLSACLFGELANDPEMQAKLDHLMELAKEDAREY